jgi:hypothetical protein
MEQQLSAMEEMNLPWSASRFAVFPTSSDFCVDTLPVSSYRETSRPISSLPAILADNLIWTGTVVCRRELLEELGGFNPLLKGCEDFDLWLRIALKEEKIAFIDNQLAVYYIGSQNSVTQRNSREFEPSQILNFRSIKHLMATQENGSIAMLLEGALQSKIDNYLISLILNGSPSSISSYLEALRLNNLPAPKASLRVIASLPFSARACLRKASSFTRSLLRPAKATLHWFKNIA